MSLQQGVVVSTATSSNVCVICLENLQSEAIGTCVPCGHCFHVQCFMDWKESKRNTTQKLKCPTCNTISKNFCRLFLDLEKLTCGRNEDDDNTNSDSDTDTSTDDGDDDDNKCDSSDPISLLDADTIAGSVIDLCQEDNNNDITKSLIKRKRKQRSTMPASTDNNMDHGNNKKVTKYKQKTKKLQQLLTQAESKSRQFIDSNKKLLDLHQSHIDDKKTLETEIKQLQDGLEVVSNSCESLRRSNEYINLECVQSRTKLQSAIMNVENEQKRSNLLQEQIVQLEQKLIYETKRARATSMNEVKTLLEKYPKLVNENNILKIDNNKKLEEIKYLRTKLGGKDVSSISSSLFDRRVLSSNSNNDKNRNPTIKVAKMLTTLNEQYENGKNNKQASQSTVVIEQQQPQQHVASSTLPKKFSSHAARISRASNEQRCQMTLSGIENKISNDKTTDRHLHHSNNNNVTDFMCSLIQQQPPKNQITNFFSKQRKR